MVLTMASYGIGLYLLNVGSGILIKVKSICFVLPKYAFSVYVECLHCISCFLKLIKT